MKCKAMIAECLHEGVGFRGPLGLYPRIVTPTSNSKLRNIPASQRRRSCWQQRYCSDNVQHWKRRFALDFVREYSVTYRRLNAVANAAGPEKDGFESVKPEVAEAESPELQPWREGWLLVKRTARLVLANAWSIVLLFAFCDALIFLLHRVCHRITNAGEFYFAQIQKLKKQRCKGGQVYKGQLQIFALLAVALRFILPASVAGEDVIGGSLWWLSNNPEIANFQSGYQWIVCLIFAVMFPLNILLRSFFTAIAQLSVAQDLEKTGMPGWIPHFKRIRSQLKETYPKVLPALSRLWQVDLLVAIRSIPLQGLSLLLLPIPWTLPRLIGLQLSNPISLFEGEFRDDAIKSSAKLVRPLRKALAFPYVGLLLTSKGLAFVGRIFLIKLSPAIARDIPEIPIVVYITVTLSTLVLNRIQDLLPLIAYIEAKRRQGKEPRLTVF